MLKEKNVFQKQTMLSIILKSLAHALLTLLIIFALMIIFFNSTHLVATVEKYSMEPNIHSGATCYASTNTNFSYNDIVLAYAPDNKKVIKRVVALGGDKIGFYFNQTTNEYQTLLIKNNSNNITVLNEDYLTHTVKSEPAAINSFLSNNAPLAKQQYNSQDVWFLQLAENEVFLLGDNRSNSVDSTEYGPLEKTDIFAKVDLVVNNPNHCYFEIIKYMLKI